MTVHLTLQIDNIYEGGDSIQTTVETDVPPPPADHESTAYDDWEYEYIFSHTGTGDRPEGDSSHFVKVISTSDENLIPNGTEYEFV